MFLFSRVLFGSSSVGCLEHSTGIGTNLYAVAGCFNVSKMAISHLMKFPKGVSEQNAVVREDVAQCHGVFSVLPFYERICVFSRSGDIGGVFGVCVVGVPSDWPDFGMVKITARA